MKISVWDAGFVWFHARLKCQNLNMIVRYQKFKNAGCVLSDCKRVKNLPVWLNVPRALWSLEKSGIYSTKQKAEYTLIPIIMFTRFMANKKLVAPDTCIWPRSRLKNSGSEPIWEIHHIPSIQRISYIVCLLCSHYGRLFSWL